MTILLLFVVSSMLFVSALGQPGDGEPRDIIRRMEELEGYNRRQQAEFDGLRSENKAMRNEVSRLQEQDVELKKAMRHEVSRLQEQDVELKKAMRNEVSRLQERDVELTNRVVVLEDRERSLQKSQEALGKQNEILTNEVNRVKENNNELVNRIAILEDGERSMKETIDALVKHIDNTGDVTMESNLEQKENGTTGRSMTDGDPKLDPVKAGDKTRKERSRPSVTHNRIRQADQEMPVAFFATLSNHTYHMGHLQPIVFDNVITNIGNAYHPTSGNFYAPVSGIYVFSTTMFTHGQFAHFEYAVNGQFMSRMFTDSDNNSYETTSQTAVFKLSQGDEVVVRNVDTDITLDGLHFCSISGFLLTTMSDNTNAQVIG